ncbi:homing endonuclease [Staphylococcus phage MarsHill]|nr:homing endonuclease [Staphylococcus phage MarsHill]
MNIKKMNQDQKNEWFQNKLDEKYDSDNRLLLLSDYKTTHEKVKIKCLKCGHEDIRRPAVLIQGNRCSSCGNRKRYTTKTLQERFDEVYPNEYEILEEYNGHIRDKMRIKHIPCGEILHKSPNSILNTGRKCLKCSKLKKKSIQETQNLIDSKFKEREFTIVSEEYINKDTPLNIKHEKCGNIINISYTNIRNDVFYCKYCNRSNGELLVANILDELGIDYEIEYNHEKVKSLKNRYMPFDFFFKINGKECAIEYDGRQHFEKDYIGFKDEKSFEERVKKDLLKNKLCEENNINLLRIRFDQNKTIRKDIFEFIDGTLYAMKVARTV